MRQIQAFCVSIVCLCFFACSMVKGPAPTHPLLYVANHESNSVSICPINEDATLGNCTSVSDPTLTGPAGVAIVSLYIKNANSG